MVVLRTVQADTGEIQQQRTACSLWCELDPLVGSILPSTVPNERVAAVSVHQEMFCFCGNLYPENTEVLHK